MNNGTYKLIIKARLKYGGAIHPNLASIENVYEASFQFSLESCVPTSIYDSSADQIASSNQTMLTYFMNNGTEMHPSPFDNILRFEPDCGPQFEIIQSLEEISSLA